LVGGVAWRAFRTGEEEKDTGGQVVRMFGRLWEWLKQYTKEVVEPFILSGEPVKKVREGLVDLYHDYKDDRIIDLLKLIESINNGG
jgi:hypothetical protein